MSVLRWALAVAALVSSGVVLGTGVQNGVLLLVLLFGALAIRPTLPLELWRAARELFDVLPGVCGACRGDAHTDCDGPCSCPLDHEIERMIAHAEARALPVSEVSRVGR